MYTWAKRNLSSSMLSQIDDIGISLYPEDHPMGVTFDRAFSSLHSLFPSQRIEITELGYWSAGLGHTWWWRSQTDGVGAGRQAVANLYQAAVIGYPYSGGEAYW
jgi:hypothetical protein